MNRWAATLVIVAIASTGWAQNYTIRGRVLDADTKEGLPFCNVYFRGTTIGVATDVDGYYEITTAEWRDSLTASALGYENLSKRLADTPLQNVDFYLSTSRFDLQEIVVLAGENPANRIVRGIIANKDRNRIESQESIQYESYAKVELDIENIDERLRTSRLLKPFEFIFENVDSTSDEKPFLPIYINEVLEDIFLVKGKGSPRNIIRAQRNSGTDNPTIVEYIKKIHAPFSIYDNWIYVLEKGFISPFANAAPVYYEYYIQDSVIVDGRLRYNLKFKPKRKQETTFYGDFWVEDSTFAIERVNMRMSPNVNINLVRRIIIYQEFKPADGLWLPSLQKMIVDFSPAEKAPGMIGRRTETFRNFIINNEQTRLRYAKTKPEDNLRDPNFVNSEDFWAQARHVPLSSTEEKVYALVDSIKNVPAYKTYTQIAEILVNGYFITGSWELGPYSSIYGINPVEGNRFRLGARTSTNFNKDLRLGGYLAYGTQDEAFKYGADFIWVMNKYPRMVVGGAYKNDISLNSESSEDFVETDFFSGTLRRNIPMKLIRVEEAKLYYERYWDRGFSNRVTLLTRYMDPYGGSASRSFDYAYLDDAERPFHVDSTLSTTEFIFKTRFAYDEILLDGNYERVSAGTKYPIIELQYALGINGLLDGDYHYHRLSFSYRHYVNINPIGWLAYRFKAGRVFGKVPFLLMEVHPGNEGFFMARGIFNTMNRYEFASDTYAQLVLEHHFDGFFLNKIPLMRKLKWREVVSFKAVIGSISEENRIANQLNWFDSQKNDRYNGFRAPSHQPYMEAGIGLENILKIIRIDAIWRLNYLDNPQASRFSVVGGFYFFF